MPLVNKTIAFSVTTKTVAINRGETITAGDSGAYIIEITYSDLASIAGTCSLHFVLPDGTYADRTTGDGVVIADNKITYTLEAALYSVAGVLTMYVQILNAPVQYTPLKVTFSGIRVPGGTTPITPLVSYPTWVTSVASAEALRVIAENARVSAEGLRVTADGLRTTAEGNRVIAEGGRVSVEQGRVSVEGNRVSAENLRVTAESARAAWHASYDAGHAYLVGEKVAYNGSSYVCILNSTGNLPTNGTYFTLMAQAGAAGTINTSTLTNMTGLIAGGGTNIQAATAAQAAAQVITDPGSYFGDDTIGGQLQSAGASLAQNALLTGINGFDGIKVVVKEVDPGNPLYVGFAFDTDGLSAVNGQPVSFTCDLVVDDVNVLTMYAKRFDNNTATVSDIMGGILETDANGTISVVQKAINVFSVTFHTTYDSTYRYVKPYACLTQTDATKFATLYIRNPRCYVGAVELTYLANGLIGQTDGSIIIDIDNINIGSALENQWKGKKANFLGDSIVAGIYYNGSAYATMERPFQHWIKDLLGLSVIRSYGVSGTHISGNYAIGDGSSGDPAQSFTARYAAMDNDADLIVVLGGVNDFVHAATAPFGTITDATDISFYGALNVLMNGLATKYVGKEIIFLLPLHAEMEATPNGVTGKTLREYNQAIHRVAENYGIKVFDLFRSGFSMNATWKAAYINDGVHLNIVAHQLFGEKMAKWLVSPTSETPLSTADLDLKANATVETWTYPSLDNSFTTDAGMPFGYRKNSFGNVELKGKLLTGANGASPITFPAGYRPTETIIIKCYTGFFTLGANGVMNLFYDGGWDSSHLTGSSYPTT